MKKKVILLYISLYIPIFTFSGNESYNTEIENFLIGLASGSITATLVEPFVYVKNTWQQNKKLSKNPLVFYRGLFVNIAGFGPAMAIQNAVYNATDKKLEKHTISPAIKNLIAATAAGSLSAIPSCPRELLIIQQQNHGGNFYQTYKKIVSKHGHKKMMRALHLMAIRNSSFAGFSFIITPILTQKMYSLTDNQSLHAIAPGIIAGSLSAIVTHPLDTIKTNMQASLDDKNIKQTLLNIKNRDTNKSYLSLYKGLVPRTCGVAALMTCEYNILNRLTQLKVERK